MCVYFWDSNLHKYCEFTYEFVTETIGNYLKCPSTKGLLLYTNVLQYVQFFFFLQ